MDKHEARLAVDFNALCESGGVRYYAYGTQYSKDARGHAKDSIILHDLRANSITQAEIKSVSIVNWNAPPELVERKLAEYRAGK